MKHRLQQIFSVIIVAAGVWLTAAAAIPQQQSQQAPKKKTQPQGQTDQQADQKQQPADQQDDRRPKQIFTGKVKLTSSRQGKNTASAGFNGVGPDGKVQEALLSGSPSEESRQKAARLTLLEVDRADVVSFARDGKLNPPPAKAEKKGK